MVFETFILCKYGSNIDTYLFWTRDLKIRHTYRRRVFLLLQIWIVNYYVKYSSVDCKYLFCLQEISLDENQNNRHNANIADCLRKPHLETHKTKQII